MKKQFQAPAVDYVPSLLPYHSYDLALIGKRTLLRYCTQMMQLAKTKNQLSEFLYYQDFRNLVTDEKFGLMLGTFLYEASSLVQSQIDNPINPLTPYPGEDIYNQDTQAVQII